MIRRRVKQRPVSDAAESVLRYAAKATKSLPRTKILLSGAFATLIVAVAVPILFVAAPVAADGTLKCYDRAGNYEPCVTQVTQVSTPPSRSNDQPIAVPRPPSWTKIALYQQANWAASAIDLPASWTTAAADQPTNETTAAVDQPAISTGAPVGRRNAKWAKHQASLACKRHLLPCIFSTVRNGLTHIASAAASLVQPRPAKEHL